MLLAFTDESYSDAHYYQAAFVIDEKSLPALASLISEANTYAQGFGAQAGIEYHGHAIMSAVDGWEFLGNKFRMKSAIYKDVLKRIAQLDATLIIQGVDVKRLNNRYKYPHSPHEVTHKNLMDAVDKYAESKGEKVFIFSDQIDMQVRLEALFIKYQASSTGGWYPRYLANILSIQYVESHIHPGVQIVDLCIYLFRRFDEHIESNRRTRKVVEKMWEILAPIIHKDYQPRVWRP